MGSLLLIAVHDDDVNIYGAIKCDAAMSLLRTRQAIHSESRPPFFRVFGTATFLSIPEKS